ncbi:hypothetical protein PV10_03899 [Exophiala mesophila]|uniref:FAD dependent oxidoreductase domain-containing protein n=1 Tax=Exophiala mesophila TaxID=212818 RepID=A0A0D1WTS9_EXOME|nr:uncharacterized protein PV10_03899 [Exophiala mesophila]KIV92625.1 hypothetical protein PV10_03899 [Exophiala mesophila]
MGDAGVPIGPNETATLPSSHPTKSFWQTSHPNPVSHHRSTPSLPSKASIVVIGTGITSVFAVDELLARSQGLDVLVLDARTTCSAATGRNGGHLVPLVHEQRPGIIAWELRNYHHVANLIESRKIPCDFRRLQSCIGFWNQTYFEEAKEALKQATELAPQQTNGQVRVVEDPDELTRLNLVHAVGALVQTTAASLSPYKLVIWLWQDLLDRYQASGQLNLQTETPVNEIQSSSSGDYTIVTHRGTVQTRHILLATNGYTSHLLPCFSKLISPRQAQMTALIPPQASPFSRMLIPQSYGFSGVAGMDREMSDYLVQAPISDSDSNFHPDPLDRHAIASQGGQLMYGGGRQHASGNGNYNSDDSYVDPEVEKYLRTLPARLDLGNSSNTTSRSHQGQTLSPPKDDSDLQLELQASWTGIIGSSADGHPWVGAVPDHPGLFIAAGYSGHGMPNAPLSGRHVARLLLQSLKTVDVDCTLLQEHEVQPSNSSADAALPIEYLVTKERMQKFNL